MSACISPQYATRTCPQSAVCCCPVCFPAIPESLQAKPRTLSSHYTTECHAETKKGAARVVRDPAEEGATGFSQLAVLSQCGRLVFAATKGTVAVHRRSDLALLDMVVVSVLPLAKLKPAPF